MLSQIQLSEIEIYGQLLTGSETELQLAQLARIQYLKLKFRPALAAAIGDYGDNLADLTAAYVLGEAIRLGLVTDQTTVASYTSYISSMLQGYGGATEILPVLNRSLGGLETWLVQQYYAATAAIQAATTVEAVNAVDFPCEPKPVLGP